MIPTNSDGGLNQVGAGAVADGVMTFSVGTSGAIRLTTSKPVLSKEPSTWCYMSPKNWLSGAATNGCCNCLDWFKEQVGMSRALLRRVGAGDQRLGEQPGVPPLPVRRALPRLE